MNAVPEAVLTDCTQAPGGIAGSPALNSYTRA